MELQPQILSLSANLTEVPEYIRVLPLGYVSSEKGDFIVDEDGFQRIHNRMKRRAIDIVIDYEHQTLKDVPAPAAGWIKDLVLKENGVFAKVQWTEKAKEYLKNKEYKYLSPVVFVKKKDHKVEQLHSVALTNCPAINGMIPIINSLKYPFSNEVTLDETQKKICRLLNLSEPDFINIWYEKGDD